jgi:putative aldouronate transport system permease protein
MLYEERNKSTKFLKNIFHIPLIIAALITITPLLVLLSTSLSNEDDVIKNGYPLIPKHLGIMAYKVVFKNPAELLNAYAVTITVTVVGSAISLFMIALVAYVISRPDYKYRRIISLYIFFTMLFNGGLVPTYILVARWMHLKDNMFAMIIPLLISAYNILLMKGFMQSIPFSIIESAKIDGASEFKTFVQIIFPISKPALATVGLFLLLAYWNDWYQCMLYIDNPKLYNLQYMLVRVLQNFEFLNSGDMRSMLKDTQSPPVLTARMAMSVIAAGPMLLIFPFFQKYFVKGITMGSVK